MELLQRITSLPRWAAVALMARATRRLLPLAVAETDDQGLSDARVATFLERLAETAAGLGALPDLSSELRESLDAYADARRSETACSTPFPSSAETVPTLGPEPLSRAPELSPEVVALAHSALRAAAPENADRASTIAADAASDYMAIGRTIDEADGVSSAEGYLRLELEEDISWLERSVSTRPIDRSTPVPGSFFPEALWPNPYPSWLCHPETFRPVPEDERERLQIAIDLANRAREAYERDLMEGGQSTTLQMLHQGLDAFRDLISTYGERPRYHSHVGGLLCDCAGMAMDTLDEAHAREYAGMAVQHLRRAAQMMAMAPAFGVRTTSGRDTALHNLGHARILLHRGEPHEGMVEGLILAKHDLLCALGINPNHEKAAADLRSLQNSKNVRLAPEIAQALPAWALYEY